MVSPEDAAWDIPPTVFGTRAGGPTVKRLVLGAQLHRLRESRRISAERAADAIRGSHSKISRMEHGRVGFKLRDVSDLLTLYGVTDPRAARSAAQPDPGSQHAGLVARLLRCPAHLGGTLRGA